MDMLLKKLTGYEVDWYSLLKAGDKSMFKSFFTEVDVGNHRLSFEPAIHRSDEYSETV